MIFTHTGEGHANSADHIGVVVQQRYGSHLYPAVAHKCGCFLPSLMSKRVTGRGQRVSDTQKCARVRRCGTRRRRYWWRQRTNVVKDAEKAFDVHSAVTSLQGGLRWFLQEVCDRELSPLNQTLQIWCIIADSTTKWTRVSAVFQVTLTQFHQQIYNLLIK